MGWLRFAGQSGLFSGLGGLAYLLARERGGRTGSDLGLAGVKRLLVVASLPCVGAGFSLVACSAIGSELPPSGLWCGWKGWEKS
jgi:hypothetical protein